MKITKISELPIVPEEYGCEVYERIDFSKVPSLMFDEERRFINGLIQYYEPESILEVGVSRGGGTVNLLNAATEGAQLVSIDYAEHDRIGKSVIDSYPEFSKDNWRLITGKDPSQVLGDLNIKFDFVVIDTYHYHPCETLNFVAMLPFLNNGAIVVVHDTFITFKKDRYRAEYFFAPRLLISSVCAEKISPKPNSTLIPNIVGFQVTEDTRKYIRNVFDVLMFPWQYFDNSIVESMQKLVKKHYSIKIQTLFEMAIKVNKHSRGIDLTKLVDVTEIESTYKCEYIKTESQLYALEDDAIFYGAGKNCVELIKLYEKNGKSFNYKVWDISASAIQEILGNPVSLPDFKKRATPGQKIVVTILDIFVANTIQKQLEALGYSVYRADILLLM